MISSAVVDGVVLKHSMMKHFATGEFNRVPVLMGNNADEMTVVLDFILKGITDEDAMREKVFKSLLVWLQAYGDDAG